MKRKGRGGEREGRRRKRGIFRPRMSFHVGRPHPVGEGRERRAKDVDDLEVEEQEGEEEVKEHQESRGSAFHLRFLRL